MNDNPNEARLTTAFVLGFLASREGFNGECSFDHLAPDELGPQNWNCENLLEEIDYEIENNPELMALCRKAVKYVTS